MKITKFQCVVCGKITSGRVPMNYRNHHERGDGSMRYPRRHKGADGKDCEGNIEEAIWIDIEIPLDKNKE